MSLIPNRSKNSFNFIHNGYTYNYKRQNQAGVKTWRCQKYTTLKCMSIIKTIDEIVTSTHGEHNHRPNEAEIEKQRVINTIYKEALEKPREAPQTIITGCNLIMNDECASRMPKYSSIQQNIAKKRRKEGMKFKNIDKIKFII